MGQEAWPRVDAVLATAIELPAAERAAFLDRACKGEPELRREVEGLLRADEAAGGFLDPAAPAADDVPPASTLAPGQTLGLYRLLERIGSGGMGEVFSARREDGAFERQVAIKIIWRGLERRDGVRRFHRERQILATLEHPHIARLYDGGTSPEGLPYLVMEKVDGVPIDRYCDRRELSIDGRLRLFLDLCDAVETAHRSLVVHRDLKPANVLVTAEGVVKLLDFGIAKLLEETAPVDPADRTRTLHRPLTPHYSSPEQARGGAITTATDVYSLGVLLFELLTGALPHSEQHILGAVLAGKAWPLARRPSQSLERPAEEARGMAALRGLSPDQLRRRLAGDLDAIVLKAIEEEPRRRYPGVGALAADLRRHLDRLPVEARPVSWRYRAGRFLGRHRTAVAAASLAVLAGAGFLTTTTLQARRIERERATAQRTLEFLSGLFESASPEKASGDPPTLRSVLDRGAERVQRELAGEPEVEGALLETLGNAYLDLGLAEPAEPLLVRAEALQRRTFGQRSPKLADVLSSISALRWHQGRYPEAEAMARRVVELLRRDPEADGRDIARAHLLLGGCLRTLERLDEAEGAYRDAAEAARGAGETDAEERVQALGGLAILSRQRGRLEEARRLYEEVLEHLRARHGPRHIAVAREMGNLGVLNIALGKNREAEKWLLQALGVFRQLGLSEHPSTALTLWNLAANASELGHFEAARGYAEESVRLQRALHPEGHPELADALAALGRPLRELGRLAEAERILEESLAIRRSALGEAHPDIGRSLGALASVHAQQGRTQEAETEYQRSLAILSETLGPEHFSVARTLGGLGRLAQSQGRLGEAENLLRQALALLERSLSADNHFVAQARGELGACLLALGRLDEAESLLRAAQPVLQSAIPHHPRTRAVEAALAELASRRARSQT